MLFNSLEYFAFFVLIVPLYYCVPHKYRWGLLLLASYYFYMCWKAEYLLLIIASTLVDYYTGRMMGTDRPRREKRKYLVLSLVSNLGLLFAFKYFNFFNDSARALFEHFNIFYGVPAFEVLLPVGISFYTFQTLSYTIDVYLGKKEPEKRLGIFAVYVAFFPQLVAGPIERSTHLLPQFFEKHVFNCKDLVAGSQLIVWGLFKKVVIADRLAAVVDQVYNNPGGHGGPSLILATYCFAFQIFCDFSGYSDIAIGSARILGFRLMKNFDRPYLARSISEFWEKWHISLSTWFRDYVFIPLGGSRGVTQLRWFSNIMAVFTVSGLWHGANWTFVIWGALHGTYYLVTNRASEVLGRLSRALGLEERPRLRASLQVLATFHFVCFAWIFFRANSLEDAIYVAAHLFARGSVAGFLAVMPPLQMLILFFCALAAPWKIWLDHQDRREDSASLRGLTPPHLVFWAFVMNLICFFGVRGNVSFIYFQF